MRSWMILFCAGVALAAWQPFSVRTVIAVYVCSSVAAWMLFASLAKVSCFKKWQLKQAVFFIGYIYANVSIFLVIDHNLPEELIRTDWRLKGTVESIQQKAESVRFIVTVESLDRITATSNNTVPSLKKVRLSWYQPKLKIQKGDRVDIDARLKPPHGFVNPAGFDYEKWLFTQQINATGYVRKMHAVEQGKASTIFELRSSVNSTIDKHFLNPKHASLLKALITGDKEGLSQADWDSLRQSGTVHLAVISGLHIGFLAWVGWWFGRALTVLFVKYRFMRFVPYMGALTFAGLYALIAGAELPVQRAYIMLSAFMFSSMFMVSLDWWSRWVLALFAVLCFLPLAIYDTGLWLSFGAVAVLIILAQRRFKWRDALKLQALLMVAMLPLYLWFFLGFALLAPFVNLLAIPLVTLVVVSTFLFLSVCGAVGLLGTLGEIWLLTWVQQGLEIAISFLIEGFWWLVESVNAVEWGYAELYSINELSLGFLCVAAILFLLPRVLTPSLILFVLFMPLVFGTEKSVKQGFSAWVYDIGQGLAVLIEVDDYYLLYDTGAKYRTGTSAAQWSLIPHLKQQGIKSIDHLILSHDDIDHVGGFEHLRDVIDFKKVTTSFPTNYPHSLCSSGQRWQEGQVVFEMLSGSEGKNDNDRSCVLLVSYGDCHLLLPGDISHQKESAITLSHPVHWLVAAHHGSRFSSSASFLKQAQPNVVIFSAGYGNPFNHPHPDVVKRVKQFTGAKTFNTATDGAIRLEIDQDAACQSVSYRQQAKRVWR